MRFTIVHALFLCICLQISAVHCLPQNGRRAKTWKPKAVRDKEAREAREMELKVAEEAAAVVAPIAVPAAVPVATVQVPVTVAAPVNEPVTVAETITIAKTPVAEMPVCQCPPVEAAVAADATAPAEAIVQPSPVAVESSSTSEPLVAAQQE